MHFNLSTRQISFLKNFLTFTLLFLFLIVIYLPALCEDYVFHDDVTFFLKNKHFTLYSQEQINVPAGRFLGSIIFNFFAQWVNFVSDLRFIRLLTIIQLSFIGCCIHYWLEKYFSDWSIAFLATAFIFTLPSFQIVISYAVCFLHPFAIIFSILASIAADKIPTQGSDVNKTGILYLLLAILLLFCALSIYQPAAMFYWPMSFLIALATNKCSPDKIQSKSINLFLIGVSALMAYGIFLKIMQHEYISSAITCYSPYKLSFDFFKKIAWFIKEPFLNSVDLWSIFPTAGDAFLIIGFIVSGFGLFVYRLISNQIHINKSTKAIKQIFSVVLATGFLLIFSFLPNLLSVSNFAFYRCCVALSFLIVLFLLWALQHWISLIFLNRSLIIFRCFVLGFCLLGALKSSENVMRYRIFPSMIEFAHIKNMLSKINLQRYKHIYIRCQDYEKIIRRYDEFGIATTSLSKSSYNTIGIVTCCLKELNRNHSGLIMLRFDPTTTFFTYIFRGYNNDDLTKLKLGVSDSFFFDEQNLRSNVLTIDIPELYTLTGPLRYLLQKTLIVTN